MPFVKNQSGNPKGKPKGSVNKTTKSTKQLIDDFISTNLDNIQKDFDKLEPKDKFYFLDKLLKYSVPIATTSDSKTNEYPIIDTIFKIAPKFQGADEIFIED